ncbi:unnamed protein product [Sphagnum balticum]
MNHNYETHESHCQPLSMRLGSSLFAKLQGMRPTGMLLEAAKHEAVSEEEVLGAVRRERGREREREKGDGTEEVVSGQYMWARQQRSHGGAGQPDG